MKKILIVTMCISLMLFTSGCMGKNSGKDTGKDMADDIQNVADDMGDAIEDVAQSIFPQDIQNKDSEYFKVTEYSTKDNIVTLKGSVMKKNASSETVEYEYGKQDSELTFDADHAEITYDPEGVSNDKSVKFSSYVKEQGDKIKDKIFKVEIKDGRVTRLEEAEYTK